MSHKATTPVPRSAKRPEMLLLEREARKETIERKGKNYRFWLFRRKLYHIVTVYALIFGLIGAIVFLWRLHPQIRLAFHRHRHPEKQRHFQL
ncbi:MAG: hypothetical protein ACLT8E_05375 [Akkermansia sp.]